MFFVLFYFNCKIYSWNCALGARIVLAPRELRGKRVGDSFAVQCKVVGIDQDQSVDRPRWYHVNQDGQEEQVTNSDRLRTTESVLSSTLVFVQAQKPDENTYTCRVFVNEETLSESLTLKLFEAINFTDTPTEQHPFAETDAEIVCHVKADPPAEILWYKGDEQITGDGARTYRFLRNNSVLVIPNYDTETDNGVYHCQAIQQDTGDFQTLDIKVEAYVKPKVTFITPATKANEGSEAKLMCGAIGTPPPNISWSRDDAPLVGERFSIMPDGELIIHNVVAEDKGLYACTAKNEVGSETKTVELDVFLKPKVEAMNNVTERRGSSVSIVCYFTGSRPLDVLWSYRPETASPEAAAKELVDSEHVRLVKEENSQTMIISELETEDAGEYICTASNTAGKASGTAHVVVEHPPTLVNKTDGHVRSVRGNEVTLFCEVSAVPLPKWTWTSPDGNEIYSDDTKFFISILPNSLTSILKVVTVDDSDYGIYRCSADNGVQDPAVANINVIQIVKPPKPTDIIFENQHPNYAEALIPNYASVEESQRPQRMVFEFVTEAEEQSENFSWDDISVTRVTVPYEPSGTYTVSDLHPTTKYVFRCFGENEAGSSPISDSVPYETVKPKSPDTPKFRPIKSPCSPQECLIEWEEPNDGGSDIVKYEIQYQTIQNDGASAIPSDSYNWISVDTGSPSDKFLVFTELEPSTNYVMRLRAQNDEGFSDWAETFVKTAEVPLESTSGMSTGGIVAIVVIVVLLFIILIDVACYFINQCGLIMCLCINCFGKTPPEVKAKEDKMEEGQSGSDDKKPLKEAIQHEVDDRNDGSEKSPMIESGKRSTGRADTTV